MTVIDEHTFIGYVLKMVPNNVSLLLGQFKQVLWLLLLAVLKVSAAFICTGHPSKILRICRSLRMNMHNYTSIGSFATDSLVKVIDVFSQKFAGLLYYCLQLDNWCSFVVTNSFRSKRVKEHSDGLQRLIFLIIQ